MDAEKSAFDHRMAIAVLLLAAAALSFSASWRVFAPASASLPMGAETLQNPGFELGSPGTATGWAPYALGYTVDGTGGRLGGRAIQLANPTAGGGHGAYQVITLGQTVPKSLYFSGWSKAQGVTGEKDSDYAVYVDVTYADGTHLWGQTLRFDTGTHAWQFAEGFIVPAKAIDQIALYCLLRNAHTGTAWFDDLSVREVQPELVAFDSAPVAVMPPDPAPYGGADLTVQTGDGLSLTLTSDGGAVKDVGLGGTSVGDPLRAWGGGFLVRDVAAGSDHLHVGGTVTQAGNTLQQDATVPSLGLLFHATYAASAGEVVVSAEVQDTTAAERAITLYFALPVAAEGWAWGDDIRRSRAVSGTAEFGNQIESWWGEVGATGGTSPYPLACLAGPSGGLAVANPLASPRVLRMAYQPATRQLYVAYDLGLSPHTDHFPSGASVEIHLYRFDGADGFRGAAQGYYDRFPSSFARRVPPQQEGIWVAFSDLSPIPGVGEFGIAFHELGGLSQVPFDESAGIFSFRYISEPWSCWMPINDPGTDPANYDQVMAYLQNLYLNGTPYEHDQAEAELSSGFFDAAGRYVYESTVEPWCSGTSGCAVFTLNPDPEVADPSYPLNAANLDWNQAAKDTYLTLPSLDGEYVDSFLGRAYTLDLRAAHFAAADIPLTFRTADRRAGVPELFATVEFSRFLEQDVHGSLARWTMANGMLLWVPWGADLFDVMGTETDWLPSGVWTPPEDEFLSYLRTLSGQKPYCFLMNTNFDNLTHEVVERYFQVALFYGLYPSMFSHNAAENRYWDNPALYERDRALFKRYVPLIRAINAAGWRPVARASSSDSLAAVGRGGEVRAASASGWRPVTRASSSNPDVYVERWGEWPDLHFTLRNMTASAAPLDLSVESGRLGVPAIPLVADARLAGTRIPVPSTGVVRTISLTLAASASELLDLLPDTDGDVLPDGEDNCASVANPGQENGDGDPAGDACDCAQGNPALWSIPSPARELKVTGPSLAALAWSTPQQPGTTSPISYDLLRSASPSDFSGALCLASDQAGTSATDSGLPPPGQVFFYLVRAQNVCGGTLGADSAGNPRAGRDCP